MNTPNRVLVLTQNPDLVKGMYPAGGVQLIFESSAAAAKRRLQHDRFTSVLVTAPLSDEYGIQTANELASVYKQFVLLLVPREKLDQAIYQTREATVFCASMPVHLPHIHQAVGMLEKASRQTHLLEEQLAKARQKLQDEKLIARCKLKLIETYHWSEEKAHAYLGKAAMDHSTTRVQVARILLAKMEERQAKKEGS